MEISLSEYKMQAGVTFIELLVTVAIIGILAAIAVPYYGDYVERQRWQGAAEDIFGQVQQAKRAAISNNRTVYLYANQLSATTSTWCVTHTEASGGAFSFLGADCSGGFTTGAANISDKTDASNYPGIHLVASGGGATKTMGFVMPGLTVSGADTMIVKSDRLGDINIIAESGMRVRLCSDDLGAYPDC